MLDSFIAPRYSGLAAETTAAGFGDLFNVRRTTAAVRFFYVRMPTRAHTINGWAWVGRPSGLPVASIAGSPTPLSARPPHLAMEGGPSLENGGRNV